MGLTKTTKSNQVSAPADFRKENIPNTSRKHYRVSYLAHSQSLYPWGKTSRYPIRNASKSRSELTNLIKDAYQNKERKKLNATREFEATFKVSDQVCNTSVWGTVYILDITATNRLMHNQFQEPPKWFNHSRENRTEPYTEQYPVLAIVLLHTRFLLCQHSTSYECLIRCDEINWLFKGEKMQITPPEYTYFT